MKKQGLEKKLKEHYKSAGEDIIAKILSRHGYDFNYEQQILVEEKRKNDGEKERLWYPDFYLKDKGIVIEYAGRPKDKDYMEGIKRKKETYEKMGLKVIIVTPYDVFYREGEGYHKKHEFESNLINAIKYLDNGDYSGLKQGDLKTYLVENYKYKRTA